MLIERLIGLEEPKIPVHAFFSAVQEYAIGTITGQQVVEAFDLNAEEANEALAIYDRIMAEPESDGGMLRRLKGMELENVLILAESGVLDFVTPEIVRARLGIGG